MDNRNEYFRQKSAAYREGWRKIGFVNTSLLVPNDMTAELGAKVQYERGKRLLQLLDEGNEDAFDVCGDRRPKGQITSEHVVMLEQDLMEREELESAEALKQLKELHESVRKEMEYRRAIGEAKRIDDSEKLFTAFAYEYAQRHVTRGLYDTLRLLAHAE